MRDHAPLVVVLVLLLGGGFALMMLSNAAGDRRLDRSVIGLDGLSTWLEESDVPVVRSNPRASPSVEKLGLRVMPLYDVDLVVEAEEPEDSRQLMRQHTQRDLEHYIYREKILELPSVVVLPKWSTGFIESKIAHEQTLIPVTGFKRLLEQLGLRGVMIDRDGPEFARHRIGWNGKHDTALFHAQTFAAGSLPDHCRGRLGFRAGIVIMECELEGANHPVFFVSDPDLMNNHGLTVSDNAALATDFLSALLPEGTQSIYMDTSPVLLTDYEPAHEERVDYERSGADLARFFEYPLSVLWAVMLFVLAVLFWRGAVRFGPLIREDGRSVDQSKTVAIATKARLLRLSDSDGQMVADFVRTQLADLVTGTFGPDTGEAGQNRFFVHLSRRDASLGKAFQASCANLINNAANMSHPELFKALESHKNLLEKVEHANGSFGLSKTR